MHMHSRLHTELDTCRALQSCKSLYACFDAMQMFLRMLGPCLHAALTRLYTLRYFMELFARRGLACAPQGHHTRLANIHTLSLSLCDCMSLPVAFEKATLAGWQGVNGAQTSFAMRARTHTHTTHTGFPYTILPIMEHVRMRRAQFQVHVFHPQLRQAQEQTTRMQAVPELFDTCFCAYAAEPTW
jgi:hypothetical protein